MDHILDTVTVSELRKKDRMDPRVRSWDALDTNGSGYISVITMNEISFGILKLEGRDTRFAKLLKKWYADLLAHSDRFPLLAVDLPIAELAALFRARFGLAFNDSLIAATARVHGLTLATRNTSDFEKTGIKLVNPWDFKK